MTKDMDFSLVILSYNRKQYLDIQLKASEFILRNTRFDLEVILVDNASDQYDIASIIEKYAFVNLIKLNQNGGAVARSEGMEVANGRIVITLDDDVYGLTPAALECLNELFESDEKLAAVNFKVTDELTEEVCNWTHHADKEKYANGEFETCEISEGAVAFRNDVLKEVGYYPKEFFISHEGADLAVRIFNFGFSMIYSSRVVVVHGHAEEGRPSWRRYFYDTRNLIWLSVRRFDLRLVLRVSLPNLFALFLYSARDGYLKYYCYALVEGVKGMSKHRKQRQVAKSSYIRVINDLYKKSPPLTKKIRDRLFRKKIKI